MVRLTIAQSRLFAGWGEQARLQLARASAVRRLRDGELLIGAGAPSDRLYIVVSGALRMVGSVGEGRTHDVAILLPGDSYNLVSVLDGGPVAYDAIARDNSVVLEVPGAALLGAARSTPDGWLPLALALCERVRTAMRYAERAARVPVRVRLARVLLDLHERGMTRRAGRTRRAGAGAADMSIAISQQALASLMSVTRPTVNGELKRFVQQQILLVDYGRIRIIDLEALTRVASER